MPKKNKKTSEDAALPRLAPRYVPPTTEKEGCTYKYVSMKLSPPPPVTYHYVDEATVRRLQARPRRTGRRVLVKHDDLAFASYLSHQIWSVLDAVARIEHVTKARASPSLAKIVELQQALRTALDVFLDSLE